MSLADKYPECAQNWIDPEDGELIPSVEYECVWRHLTRDGKIIATKEELRKKAQHGDVSVHTLDSGHTLVKISSVGWFALPEDMPALRELARNLV